MAEFQDDVSARGEGEGAVKCYDVRMGKLRVDLKFCHELRQSQQASVVTKTDDYLLRQLRRFHLRLHNLERN